ncbi:MAG: 50S ribosomal protein L15 [Candidatus Moranbacteria bacterium GW2011_GWF2_36_839]|nr:MAG: 50S ribosomal protein L15 [Candidatus Moranbacteria bacterium GW2011_GWF1_36_78]KKQ16608.1 MAG: 50S ribosomal protein L15 [Candidatus Moranbacteria bacterium GW2011_GWF2_36_839]HAT73510.1 50S ribosomal protein L15 [Candidatus Moranbacteria bacterium]HBY11514.1 50S ribosomal protein L15 [Candidatus Moranbacteria bacterium]
MQVNTLKLNSKKKKRKTVGRGGKKGTYCGKGNKGQKARSGAHVDPLFEGGRSTLIDHMKKKKGFKSRETKATVLSLDQIEKEFKDGETVNVESLVKTKLLGKVIKREKIKILGGGISASSADRLSKKLSFSQDILLSKSAKEAIEKAGGKVIENQEAEDKK